MMCWEVLVCNDPILDTIHTHYILAEDRESAKEKARKLFNSSWALAIKGMTVE